MTKTTEELKREMYGNMAAWKMYAVTTEGFEESLDAYLEALRQEHSDLRNRLQAFAFANKSAGELLIEAQTTIRRQREFIRTLYTSRKARKSKRATRIQSSGENVSETICGPLLSACQHSWRDQFADLSGEMQKQCIFCLTIKEA